MRKYLLDNGPLVALLRGRQGAEQLMRPWLVAQEVVTSQVVYGEAIEYIKGDTEFVQRRDELRTLLRAVAPLQLTYAILERYADLRRTMRPPHGPELIGGIDTLIAATALEHGLTIVTLDGDFTRIPALPVMRLTRDDLLA